MDPGEMLQPEEMNAERSSRRVLFFMATFSTVLGALYLLGLAGRLIVDGTVHAMSSPAVEAASATIAILWNVALLILFAALRRQYPGSHELFAELAYLFMALVCGMSSLSWFVQLAIVPRLAGAGDPAGLALLDMHNELSVTYAMEHLGWGWFYGLAAIFAGISMRGGKLESWIRPLFVAGGALSLLHVIGILTGSSGLSDLGYIAWGVLLPVTTALLAVRYR